MAAITEDAIRQLASFRSDGAPVITCYLDVDGRRFVRPSDVEAELDRVMRRARERLASDGRPSPTADLGRIERYVRDGFDRSNTRGLAMFSCEARDLWRVVPLPVRVHSRVVVNAAPAVGQLEAVVQELDRVAVLLVDRQRARLFVFDLGELVDHSELFDELPRGYDARGRGDLGYEREQQHVEALAGQHLRRAAEVTFELFRDEGFEHLALAVPAELASTVEGLLHPYLRERYRGRLALGPAAGVDEIRAAALEVQHRAERDLEAATVARLRDGIPAGRAVAGLDATLDALVRRRVDVLVVSQGFSEPGWRCEQCGHLCLRGPSCPVDGSRLDHIDDVVEEAMDAALAQSCRVEVCVDNADLDVLGRVGALLRF